nr:immunoglobulin light chain junction region [Macaca mulatta]
CQQSDRNLPTF